MSFLVNTAYAAGTAAPAAGAVPQGGGAVSTLLFLLVFFVLFYLMFIRPQSKRAKDHRSMLEKLQKGDEIVTSGGILGKIKDIGDNFVVLEIADNTDIKIQKPAIAACMPKGTIKSN